jgi:hypothetical protein
MKNLQESNYLRDILHIELTAHMFLSTKKMLYINELSAFRDRGVPKPTSECAACPSPDGSSAWASAKGGSEVAGDGRERGGNPAAFVFVPCPGRVRLQ